MQQDNLQRIAVSSLCAFSVTIVAGLLAATTGHGGNPASFGDLRPGRVVEVEGTAVGGRRMRAAEIGIQPEGADEHKLTGKIDAIDASGTNLTVLGVKVVAAADTEVEDREDMPLALSSLKRGWVVKVKGKLGEDDVFRAAKIQVKESDSDSEIQGPVQAVDEARRTLSVMGFTVDVSPLTKIEFEGP